MALSNWMTMSFNESGRLHRGFAIHQDARAEVSCYKSSVHFRWLNSEHTIRIRRGELYAGGMCIRAVSWNDPEGVFMVATDTHLGDGASGRMEDFGQIGCYAPLEDDDTDWPVPAEMIRAYALWVGEMRSGCHFPPTERFIAAVQAFAAGYRG